MKVIKNKILHSLPIVQQTIDSTKDTPFTPCEPLPKNPSQFFYFVGHAGSGKTTTAISMLMSKKTKKNPDNPIFYYRFYDNIILIDPSNKTKPKKFISGLNENNIYDKYSEELITDIIEDLYEDENENSLIILDDSIRDINSGKNSIMNKIILNRRHICYNPEHEKNASLSVWIMSQKYNLLDLSYRNNASVVFLWKTENSKEKKAIKEELMANLDDKTADEVFKMAWSKKFNFLMIKCFEPTIDRYYSGFDKIVFDNNETNTNTNINENTIIID
tara:strand:- start:477 stop:1301 length:825 start_codon:yes stop_codon:yes gene_type:complete